MRHIYSMSMGIALFGLVLVGMSAHIVHAAPAGFSVRTVADGLMLPVTFDFAPDGRIFVAEKAGVVRIIDAGTVLSTPFYTIPSVNTYIDRGLIGLALDPNFAENGWVYLSYTHDVNPSDFDGPKMARVIRVRANGNVADPASVEVILGKEVGNASKPSCNQFPAGTDCIPSDSGSHSAGGLRFGPDGLLYAEFGDGAAFDIVDPNAYKAQNLDWLTGKTLRVRPDGTAPTDNPFYNGDPNANRSKVYTLGHRNSFRYDFRPANGALFMGDVGWGRTDEINVATPGANFGWPCMEGTRAQDAYQCTVSSPHTPPIFTLEHNDGEGPAAIVGGSFTGNAYPAEYRDDYIFADFHRNTIYHMEVTADNTAQSVTKWFDGTAAGPVAVLTGPDGSIYYLSIFTGELRRIVHETMLPQNEPPVARNDSVVVFRDTPKSIYVQGNDTDSDGDIIAVVAVTKPTHGTVVIDKGVPFYTPKSGYLGPDSFSYTISDGSAEDTATVSIDVREVGDPDAIKVTHLATTRSKAEPVVSERTLLTTTVRNDGGAGSMLVHLELRDVRTDGIIKQTIFDSEYFRTDEERTFTMDWLPEYSGTYAFSVGYFTPLWGKLHAWIHQAERFSVVDRQLPGDDPTLPTDPDPTEPFALTVTDITVANPAPVLGDTVTATVTVENTGVAGAGILLVEFKDDMDTVWFDEFDDTLSFAAGETRNITVSWTPEAPGTYHVDAGTFEAAWASLYDWMWHGATFVVGDDTGSGDPGDEPLPTAPFELVLDTLVVTEEAGQLTIVPTVKNTGVAGSGVLFVEVKDTADKVIKDFYDDPLVLGSGESASRTYTYTLPSTGTYHIDVGLFTKDWVTLSSWHYHKETVVY
jgi:glucose/arabinose dehydrogenase